jgi:hypothetical protein
LNPAMYAGSTNSSIVYIFSHSCLLSGAIPGIRLGHFSDLHRYSSMWLRCRCNAGITELSQLLSSRQARCRSTRLLVLRWPLNTIDHQHLDRSPRRFQLQA